MPLETRTQEKIFYDNLIRRKRGLRIGFWPILGGVPRFGPPHDPNITFKKLKTEKTDMGYTFLNVVDT